MAKYIMRIELVRSVTELHGGRGGYWEDRGYECTRDLSASSGSKRGHHERQREDICMVSPIAGAAASRFAFKSTTTRPRNLTV